MIRAAGAEERCSVRGIVEAVFYSGPTFTAGRLRTPEGAVVNFAGERHRTSQSEAHCRSLRHEV